LFGLVLLRLIFSFNIVFYVFLKKSCKGLIITNPEKNQSVKPFKRSYPTELILFGKVNCNYSG